MIIVFAIIYIVRLGTRTISLQISTVIASVNNVNRVCEWFAVANKLLVQNPDRIFRQDKSIFVIVRHSSNINN